MHHVNVNVNLMVENVLQTKYGIMVNVGASVKNIIFIKKDSIWNPATCSCEDGKYLASIMFTIQCDLVIAYHEIIDVEATLYDKKQILIKKI